MTTPENTVLIAIITVIVLGTRYLMIRAEKNQEAKDELKKLQNEK